MWDAVEIEGAIVAAALSLPVYFLIANGVPVVYQEINLFYFFAWLIIVIPPFLALLAVRLYVRLRAKSRRRAVTAGVFAGIGGGLFMWCIGPLFIGPWGEVPDPIYVPILGWLLMMFLFEIDLTSSGLMKIFPRP